MKNDNDNILKMLMRGPIILPMTGEGVRGRQLVAAKLKVGVMLRARLETLEDPGDAADWEEVRRSLGTGKVMCPECEGDNDPAEPCGLCNNVGMVPRKVWDGWYLVEKSCPDYKTGCEVACPRTRCQHDTAREANYSLVLVLEATTDGKKWKVCGNSLDGYRVEGLCSRPLALLRFLNIISDSVNALSFEAFAEEEEE